MSKQQRCRLLRDKQACWGRGRLLCRRASCQVHFSHLFLPSFTSDTSFHCLPSPGLSASRLATCLQSSRHCAAEEPRLVLCSGLRRQIQRCSRCPSARYYCLNRTSVSCLPSDYLAMQQLPVTTWVHLVCLDHSISEEMLGLPLIGCDCGSSLMQSWLGCQIKAN